MDAARLMAMRLRKNASFFMFSEVWKLAKFHTSMGPIGAFDIKFGDFVLEWSFCKSAFMAAFCPFNANEIWIIILFWRKKKQCFIRFWETRCTGNNTTIRTIDWFNENLETDWAKEFFWHGFSDEKLGICAGHGNKRNVLGWVLN